MFDIISGWFAIFWWFNAIVIAYWKQLLSSSFFGFIVANLFLIYLRDFKYDPPRFNLFYEVCNLKAQHFQI